MRNTKSKIIIVMCIAICFMAIGYAAFSTSLSITGTSNITSTWNVVFTKIEEVSKTSGVTIVSSPTASGTSATFNVGLELPGDKIVYQITIENKGTIDAKVQNIVASASDSPAIINSLSGIQIGEEIKKQTTKTFTVTIEYNPATTSQPDITNKTLTVDITMVQSTGASTTPSNPSISQPLYLSSAIFRDNVAYADNTSSTYVTSETGIDFSAISSDTNGKGLYYTNTNTENNLPTYYFRGAVDNNNVKFGAYNKPTCTYNGEDVIFYTDPKIGNYIRDNLTEEQCTSTPICDLGTSGQYRYATGLTEEYCTGVLWGRGEQYLTDKATYFVEARELYWKIVRINEDGSIRLVTKDFVGYTGFNTEYHYNAFVGYMYGNYQGTTYQDTHQNINSSNIKNYLDNWYGNQSNLNNYSNLFADVGFCSDRSVYSGTGVDIDHSYYGARNRLIVNKTPQFKCPQTSDLFTTNISSKGNKSLTYPIGLLTADELSYAGDVFNTRSITSYLYNGEDYWTMSPDKREGIGTYVFLGGDSLYTNLTSAKIGVRPVVNLKSNVEITSGDGTSGNPYIIK